MYLFKGNYKKIQRKCKKLGKLSKKYMKTLSFFSQPFCNFESILKLKFKTKQPDARI